MILLVEIGGRKWRCIGPGAEVFHGYELIAEIGCTPFDAGRRQKCGAVGKEIILKAFVLGRQPGDDTVYLRIIKLGGEWHNPEEAQRYLAQALDKAKTVNDKNKMADALQELACLSAHFGQYASARQQAEESLVLSKEIGRTAWIAWAQQALGWTAFSLGEYERAGQYYRDSLTNFEHVGHYTGIAVAQGELGYVNWAKGPECVTAAQELVEQAIHQCRGLGYRLGLAHFLGLRAQIANDRRAFALAEQFAQEGWTTAQALGTPIFMIYNLCCLAEAAYKSGHFNASRRYLTDGLTVAIQSQLTPSLAIVLYHYAALLLAEYQEYGQSDPISAMGKAKVAVILRQVTATPACWRVYHARATQLLTQLETTLSRDTIAATRKMVRPSNLTIVASEVLNEIACTKTANVNQQPTVAASSARDRSAKAWAALGQDFRKPLTTQDIARREI